MNKLNYRIGQIVPSSNTTMETETLALVDIVKDLKIDGADAIVLSACVQMPSLASIPIVEDMYGLPVISAASCTVYTMLQRQGIERKAPNAGRHLGGNY
jgi:maleate isomerase